MSESPAPACSGTFSVVSSFVPGPPVPGIERPLVERDEEDAVVARKIASVPFPWWTSKSTIATRSSPSFGLRVPRGDRDVVEQAEAHRPIGERVVPRWPHEREAAAVDRLERDPRRERRRVPRRLRADRVGVEVHGPVDGAEQRQVAGRVDARELLDARPPLDRLAAEPEQPVLPLRVVPGRVQCAR